MICSLSPSVRGKEGGDAVGEFRHQRPDRIRGVGGRRGSRGIQGRSGSFHTRELRRHPVQHAMGMADAAIAPGTPIPLPAFVVGAHPRLKQLIRRDTEEIGQPVQILQLDLPLAVQELVDPGAAVPERGR
jgi:hypothetical protein